MMQTKRTSCRSARLVCLSLLFGSILLITLSPASAQLIDMDKLHGLKARSIGPAGMSGRVTAIHAVHSNPDIIYIGTASGGLWKSTSGGIAWTPVFDEQKVASIGAVAIDQRNPDVIWVGTGEGNPRNSQTSGNGVYKSLDGGKSWIHLGLDNTRNIHRLVIHPDNSDVVYVGAQGTAWGENPERGVYKTSDGGKTWEKILYVNEKTGVADLVMDPSNPNKLFAAMWEYRRWPWFFKSGGPGSGLHVTFDGGKTWKKHTDEDGLPKGELGRIGLAIARSSPNVVYALVESKKNALYRSDDGGFKWTKVADKNIGSRPFYYCEIYVDPKNENRVYNIHSLVHISEDGGKTFETLLPFSRVHPDHHAWWIHPEDADFIIDGNDGGAAISRDRGKTWRFIENLPLAQFYHINVDMETPYNVYGGMQDNGSWRGPSQVWRAGGIRNAYWEEVAFGDGFDVVPDRSDSRYGYAMSQGGFLRRYDLLTGEQRLVRPIHPNNVYLRFNWNAGIAHDPFSPTTIYYGSQFLHKSTDRGNTWEIISPDLTTNDPEKQKQLDSGGLTYDVTAAENFTTIIAIAPSPVQPGVIWAGTDDGNVQLTRDGGKAWTNVVKNIKGVPAGTWVPQIQASTYNAAEAFVVFDNHRRNDWTPYVFHTKDFGQTWRRLADEKKVWGYALSIAQDPIEPKLLFLGAEFGLYVSIDGGENWTKWKHGYPAVSTMDLVIHPREHDLVIGTFGRAAYVLDDIRPLRALAKEGVKLLDRPLHVFEVPDAILAVHKQAAGTRFAAEAEFAGENRPYGALITFAVKPDTASRKIGEATTQKAASSDTLAKADSVKIEILSAAGKVIRTFKAPAKAGVNRAAWDLSRKGVRNPNTPKPKPGAPEPEGPPVLPGTYTVRINYGKHQDSAKVNVKLDPRLQVSENDLQARNAMVEQLMAKTEVATEAADRLREAQKTIELVAERIKDRKDETAKSVKDKGKAMQDSIKALLELINPKEVQGIQRDPLIVSSRLRQASSYLQSSSEAPGETERIAAEQATENLQQTLAKINAFFAREWPAYQQAVEAAAVTWFEKYAPLQMK
ncbi:hypothetical protein L0337_20250 [candidate division KSB1 bacterium]|nr:hypothetical protein [candidate division KSB1 bacterium]